MPFGAEGVPKELQGNGVRIEDDVYIGDKDIEVSLNKREKNEFISCSSGAYQGGPKRTR